MYSGGTAGRISPPLRASTTARGHGGDPPPGFARAERLDLNKGGRTPHSLSGNAGTQEIMEIDNADGPPILGHDQRRDL